MPKSFKHVHAVFFFFLAVSAARAQSPFGEALTFDGTNQYVNIPNFGNIIPTNEITVEFWANTSVATVQSAFILDPDNGNNRLNAHLNYGTSPAQGVTYWDFGNISTGGRVGPVAAGANSVGTWVHYAFVASQSGNFMSIYTNGMLMATRAGMTPFVRGAYDLHIGGGSNLFCYHGSIDEFRVWNVARSQAQIQAHLGVPLAGSETNLVVYYRFDSIGGTLAANSATATGPAYNGTLVNSPAWGTSTVPNAAILNSLVTSLADSGPGTLRGAIVNALPGTTITFAAGLSGSTISLATGPLTLNQNLTIDASGLPVGLAIDGMNAGRIFTVNAGVSNCLVALTLTNGNAGGAPGGAIANSGALELDRCTVISNTTLGQGGGIGNSGTMLVNACTFAGNSSTGGGGTGGGIYNGGALTVNQSTFTGNSANGGGAIFSDTGSTLAVYQSTIVSNVAFCCGGGISLYTTTGNRILLNSIVAGNGNGDLYGPGSSLTLSGNDLIGANPAVAPLANNGGPTRTMALLPGSPAINAAGPVDEIEQVTVTGPPGGAFFLTFNGATTPALPVGADAAHVSSELNKLPTIAGAGGSVSVTVTGNVYTITFGGTLSGVNVNQLTTSGSGGTTAAVSTVLDGMPVPAYDQRGSGFPRLFGGAVDVGAVELSPDIMAFGAALFGTEGTATGPEMVAGFANRLGGTTAADYIAAITWGDGTPATAGTITVDSMGNFSVTGNHTYAEEGIYSVSVTITNTASATPAVTATSNANIGEAFVSAQGGFNLTGTATVAIPPQVIATFTDLGGNESITDYVATIFWGDGTPPMQGTIVETSTGQFEVIGGHTYAVSGTYTVLVGINNEFYFASPASSLAIISRANATITAAAMPSPSVYGEPLIYTATVAPPSADLYVPTGLVQFIVDGTYIGIGVPINPANGQASISGAILPPGTHSLAVTYSGDPIYSGGLATGTINVLQANTLTSVASSLNPSSLGQAVTFTAMVTSVAPSAGTPTGTVQFAIDGVNAGAPAILDTLGRAQMTTSNISAAGSPHTITAQYSGDPNFNAGAGTLFGGQVVTSPFASPFVLAAPAKGTNGTFGFAFTNVSGGSFTVFASTNPALPLSAWSNLGTATESPGGSGHFQFTDTQAPGNLRRFYRVRSP